jgi:aromatic ring-opening dioxygenase LigB subunit
MRAKANPYGLFLLVLLSNSILLPFFVWTFHETGTVPSIAIIAIATPPTANNNVTVVDDIHRIPGLLLPHGDFALDPTLVDDNDEFDADTRRAAYEVALGSRRAAVSFLKRSTSNSTASKTTILLLTPHGIQLDHDFGLYMAQSGSGTATIGEDLGPRHNHDKRYNITLSDLPMDLQASQDLLNYLQQHDHQNVSGIYPYNEASPMPLNWGEIIPLELLRQRQRQQQQQQQQLTASTRETTKLTDTIQYMILSIPHRRYDHAADMVPELLRLGESLGDWIQQQQQQQHTSTSTSTTTNVDKQFSVVVSGDLSHTHQASGPYGYSNTSSAYDRALGKWASDPCRHQESLLQTARRLQPHALSCGFTGYVIWHGILQSQWRNNQAAARGRKTKKTRRRLDEPIQSCGVTDVAPSLASSSSSTSVSTTATATATATARQLREQELLETRKQPKEKDPDDGTRVPTRLPHDDHSSILQKRTDQSLYSKVYVNRNVTYYGMMAATFLWDD